MRPGRPPVPGIPSGPATWPSVLLRIVRRPLSRRTQSSSLSSVVVGILCRTVGLVHPRGEERRELRPLAEVAERPGGNVAGATPSSLAAGARFLPDAHGEDLG